MSDEPSTVEATPHPQGEGVKPETPPNAVEAAAAEVREKRADGQPAKRGRGRPPGSKGKSKSSGKSEPELTPAPAPPSEVDIAATAGMCAGAWKVLAKFLHRRELTKPEARDLALAVIPVMDKYLGPNAEKYAPEIGLGMSLFGLWMLTELPPEKKPPELTETTAAEIPASPGG